MTRDTQKPPRNRVQELPPRKGDSIEHTTPPERGQGERERNAPLPEEETYEPDLRVRVRRHIDRVLGPRLHPRSQGRSLPPALGDRPADWLTQSPGTREPAAR